MYFKFLSRFILVLLTIFITAVGCTFPEMEPSYEVWAVDQSGTESDGTGGLLYIWDGQDIFVKDAKDATPEIIDLAEAAKDANCDAPKKPHMILSNYTTPKASHASPSSRAEDKCFRNRHVQDSLGPELFQQSVELSEVPTPTNVFSCDDDGLVLAHGCGSSFNGGLAETD